MQQPIHEVKRSPVSLDGLEDVFETDTTVIEDSSQADIKPQQGCTDGLTIRQASQHYRLAIPTIRLRIKTGSIPAIKVDGPKGPEWRVFPNGVPQQLDQADITVQQVDAQPDNTETEEFYQADRSIAEGFHQANINVANLIKANQDLTAKLEGVVYRNGYLEAQLEAERQQVKLLTDQLHQPETVPAPSWWARFSAWFRPA